MLSYEQESQSSCSDAITPGMKMPNEGRFQAAITRSKRIISDPAQNSIGNSTPKYSDAKANLQQALLNRKKSVFNLNMVSGIGRSPKNFLIPEVDAIKENESES